MRAAEQFYLGDALGSTVGLTDPSGSLVTEYTYQPFGLTSLTGVPSLNPFQFTGRENDGTGLYHNRFRYLHPALGRFISGDPIGLLAGDPNLYAYVNNNPVRLTDPAGLVVSSLVMRGVNIVLRTGATAQDIAFQALMADTVIGGLATFVGLNIAPAVRGAEIPGFGGMTVGTSLDLLTGYGGIRTLGLTSQIVATAGLAGVSVAAVPLGTTVFLVGLTALGTFELGTALNNLVLNNLPGGNPAGGCFAISYLTAPRLPLQALR